QAPRFEDVERLGERVAARLRDLGRGLVGVGDRDVGTPHRRRRPPVLLGADGGDVTALEPGHEVAAGRLRRHLVLELPSDETAVDARGSLGIGLRGVDPARHAGRVLGSLQHVGSFPQESVTAAPVCSVPRRTTFAYTPMFWSAWRTIVRSTCLSAGSSARSRVTMTHRGQAAVTSSPAPPPPTLSPT